MERVAGHIGVSARALGWMGFYGLILLAWFGLAEMNRAFGAVVPGAMPADFWAALCLSASEAAFGPLAAMWGLMVLAMMAPTFVPTMRTYLALPVATTAGAAGLLAGYLAVWFAAALAGAAAQMGLAGAALVTPLGESLSVWLAAALLLVAGAYQFTAMKAACLTRCRMPLTLFLEHWRPGAAGAAAMGVRFGLACVGCCWALMALAFVGGTMNLAFMGIATLFMAMEKLPGPGRWLTAPAGAALVAAGLVTALHGANLI